MAQRIKTPKFRVAFPSVFEAADPFGSGKPKFSITMLFEDGTDLSSLKTAAKQAVVEKWPDATKRPKSLVSPFKDGNEKSDWDGYEGATYIKASSKLRPGIIDKSGRTLTEDSEFYAGCYAVATVIPFAYDTAGNRGVSFLLGNVMKVDEGEPFGGRRNAETDFADDIEEKPEEVPTKVEKVDVSDIFGDDEGVPF